MAKSIEVRGDKRAQANLAKFADKLANPLIANKAVAVQLYSWTIRNFDAEGAEQSPPWPRLAERTIERKRRIGKERMLVISGQLRASLLPFWTRENAGIGSQLSYARYHEEGTATLPQRKLLPTRELVSSTGLRIYNHYVGTAARQANV
jgi:phage gpG-like protein